MVIYLPGEQRQPEPEAVPSFDELTPREIVAELDKYIVGPGGRQARRGHRAAQSRPPAEALSRDGRGSPAEKYPDDRADRRGQDGNRAPAGAPGGLPVRQGGSLEVHRSGLRRPRRRIHDSRPGRDLHRHGARGKARRSRRARRAGRRRAAARSAAAAFACPGRCRHGSAARADRCAAPRQPDRTREKLRAQLREGKLDQRMVEVEVRERAMPAFEIVSNQGIEEMDINVKDMLSGFFGQQKKKRKMTVAEAFDYLIQEEENKLIDMDHVTRIATERAEQMGIIFIDEIDKIAGRETGHGPDVSREGVQRDILPIVEGTTVNTRYGMVRTDHILFIAAGAFHITKPSDLIPELQGRLPLRVELSALTEDDFVRILTEPKNALIKQYIALLETEGVKLVFTDDAIAALARFAVMVNEQTENIGARRLHTILERVLDEISFEAPELKKKNVKIDAAYVTKQLAEIAKNQDLSRYIL